jgi:hypothetical protein
MKTKYFTVTKIGNVVQLDAADWNLVKRWIEKHGGKMEEKPKRTKKKAER